MAIAAISVAPAHQCEAVVVSSLDTCMRPAPLDDRIGTRRPRHVHNAARRFRPGTAAPNHKLPHLCNVFMARRLNDVSADV